LTTLTAALLDRITHRARVMNMNGTSFRQRWERKCLYRVLEKLSIVGGQKRMNPVDQFWMSENKRVHSDSITRYSGEIKGGDGREYIVLHWCIESSTGSIQMDV